MMDDPSNLSNLKMLFSSSFNASSGGESMDSIERMQDFEQGEEGVGVSQQAAKPARPRSSGSKRSRAAEVHNLSEKRRRSRINEKMRALQSLIPNSNKTDKASMLDEAIEYLKQLQLQVQMLSMRNGLYLDPNYLSGALQQLQTSHLLPGLGVSNNGTGTNTGLDVAPVNPHPASQLIFEQLNHSANPRPTALGTPGVPNISTPSVPNILPVPESLFQMELPVSAEGIFREEAMPKHLPTPGQISGNLPDNGMESGNASTSQNYTAQGPQLVDPNHLRDDVVPRVAESQLFIQHLRCLQSGRTEVDVKAESKES